MIPSSHPSSSQTWDWSFSRRQVQRPLNRLGSSGMGCPRAKTLASGGQRVPCSWQWRSKQSACKVESVSFGIGGSCCPSSVLHYASDINSITYPSGGEVEIKGTAGILRSNVSTTPSPRSLCSCLTSFRASARGVLINVVTMWLSPRQAPSRARSLICEGKWASLKRPSGANRGI